MVNYRRILFLLIVFSLISGGGSPQEAEASPSQGERLYKRYCAVCHGEKGEGNGPAARLLFPKPRDLTSGLFKVRSTPTGEPPTDNDILQIIKNGMPGSAMPAFVEFKKSELTALAGYVKKLGNIKEKPLSIIRAGTPPPVTTELIEKGRKVYENVKCWECHGREGKGDGPKADKLVDDWKQPAPPNTFTMGIYKGGGSPSDIYLRFTTGMDGSPMPSYEDSLTDEERWAVVFYTLSLAGPAVAKQPAGGRIIAKKIRGAVPSDPDDENWRLADVFKIPLILLWQRPDLPQRLIAVKALHNGKEIAILIEWDDASMDSSISDLDVFSDGVALQFPAKTTPSSPPFWMGEKSGIVNIWLWKADLQESINKSKQLASSAENLMAGGFGTLELKSGDIYGNGKWKQGKWAVVFKRSMSRGQDPPEADVRFIAGRSTPVAFSVWDGTNSDVNGRKAVSTWYYLIPDR